MASRQAPAFAGFDPSASRCASGEVAAGASRASSAPAFAASRVGNGPIVRARPSSSSESASVTNQRPAPSDSSVNRSSADTYRPASARDHGLGGLGGFTTLRRAGLTRPCYGATPAPPRTIAAP